MVNLLKVGIEIVILLRFLYTQPYKTNSWRTGQPEKCCWQDWSSKNLTERCNILRAERQMELGTFKTQSMYNCNLVSDLEVKRLGCKKKLCLQVEKDQAPEHYALLQILPTDKDGSV